MCEQELKDSRILIVEDRESNVRFLERLLAKDGYRYVRSTQDPRQAKSVFREYRPDLVPLDLPMPHSTMLRRSELPTPSSSSPGSFLSKSLRS
jgi:PleD family two-component response regulator